MHEGVTISHRGRSYEIGRGPGYYGIWLASAPGSQPIEWWPETPEGWHAAWSRFTTVEAPETITAVSQAPAQADAATAPTLATSPTSPTSPDATDAKLRGPRLIAPILLAIAGICGIAGLFPTYLFGASLAQQSQEIIPHAIYQAALAVSVVLLLMSGSRPRIGALVALGTTAVTLGLYLVDLGSIISAGSQAGAGAGLSLSLAGWLFGAAGSVLAVIFVRAGAPARPRSREDTLAIVLAGVAALGAAIAFAPSWDSFTLQTANGFVRSLTEGNAFANPAPLIAGDIVAMVALVAVVVVAALWQPAKYAAALVAGAIVPMVAQAISAIVQIGMPVSPLQFGLSPQQAGQLGLTITSGLTPAFWVYCAFLIALVLLCVRMLTSPGPIPPAPVAVGPTPMPSPMTTSSPTLTSS